MDEFRIFSAAGQLGQHFPKESLDEAVRRGVDLIACDAGSTDTGPYYLGTGKPYIALSAIRRDLELMLLAGRRLDVPVIVGSAGWSGTDIGLYSFRDLVLDIAAEHGLEVEVALIHAEVDRDYLKDKIRTGRTSPLAPWQSELDEATVDRAAHVVGCMAVEPYIHALDNGANVVIAGRSTDPAVFAGAALRHGFPDGVCWHAGKILECGGACALPPSPSDSILVTIQRDGFLVEALNPALGVSPRSVATQVMHETSNPLRITEAVGEVDVSQCRYELFAENIVRVTGSRITPASAYSIKLEAAELVGYRTVDIAGIRDPRLMEHLEQVVDDAIHFTETKMRDAYGFGADTPYQLHCYIYGKDAVMQQREPTPSKPHEVAVVTDVVAPTQEMADAVAVTLRMNINHGDYPGKRTHLGGNVASAFPVLPSGEVYRFSMCHLVYPEDPLEMFPQERLSVRGARVTALPASAEAHAAT